MHQSPIVRLAQPFQPSFAQQDQTSARCQCDRTPDARETSRCQTTDCCSPLPPLRKHRARGSHPQTQHAITTWIMTRQARWRFSTRAGATCHVRRQRMVARLGSTSLHTRGYRWLTYRDSCTHARLISPHRVECMPGLVSIGPHPSHSETSPHPLMPLFKLQQCPTRLRSTPNSCGGFAPHEFLIR
jgi:hypothetical protein